MTLSYSQPESGVSKSLYPSANSAISGIRLRKYLKIFSIKLIENIYKKKGIDFKYSNYLQNNCFLYEIKFRASC